MVSALKSTTPLLAVTELGHYTPQKKSEIEGFNLWFDETISFLESAQRSNESYNPIPLKYSNTDLPYRKERDTMWLKNIDPQVHVIWGQGIDSIVPQACEGMYCPNGVAGCANTAMAMVMYFLNRPSSISLTYLPDHPNIKLNWDQLGKYLPTRLTFPIADEYIYPQSDYPIRDNLAHLLRELGHRANSVYNPETDTTPPSTSTKTKITPNLLRSLSLASTSGWEEGAGVESYDEVFYHNKAIVLERGTTLKGAGHQWICDGLRNFIIREIYYESPDGGKSWEVSEIINLEEYYLIHYNWGQHGLNNGYFHRTDLATNIHDQQDSTHLINRLKYNRRIIPIIN